jgi:hypothetical protein
MAMGAQPGGLKLWDRLITVLAVWLILSVAGIAGSVVPGRPSSAVTASALFVVLLITYSVTTAPGRRATMAVYMGAGVGILPLAFTLLLLIDRTDRYDLSWMFVGGGVGYMLRGAGDSGFIVAWFVWWMSILLLIYLSLVLRMLFVRKQHAGQSIESNPEP